MESRREQSSRSKEITFGEKKLAVGVPEIISCDFSRFTFHFNRTISGNRFIRLTFDLFQFRINRTE